MLSRQPARVVHCLDRLRQLAAEADPAGAYEWQAGRLRAGFGRSVTYLIGVPRR